MNFFFAANMFDNPWAVAVVLVVGALVNWLAKRFNDRQAVPPREGEGVPPAAGRPSTEFNLEDALRRLMGEEPLAPVSPPPVISDPARREMAADVGWEVAPRSDSHPLRPPPTPPPSDGETVIVPSGGKVEGLDEAARRFEELRERARRSVGVVGHRFTPQAARAVPPTTSRWRNPRYARKAWIASIVFGPPTSLKP